MRHTSFESFWLGIPATVIIVTTFCLYTLVYFSSWVYVCCCRTVFKIKYYIVHTKYSLDDICVA